MITFSRLRPAMLLPILCVGLLGLSGCGDRTVTIKGTLVTPPNLPLTDNDSVAINFQPASSQGPGGLGVYTPADKSFVVKSADGKGMAPGKYKVSVQITPYPGREKADLLEAAAADLNTAYSSGAKLSFDVTDEAMQNIVIDLTKGTITKK